MATVINQCPNLGPTLGVLFLGLVFCSCLFGVTCVQAIYYYRTYEKDTLHTKLWVALIWILTSIHQAFFIHAIYYYVILNFNQPDVVDIAVWSLLSVIIIEALIGFMVELFLIKRLWRLSNNLPLSAVAFVLALGHFATHVAYPSVGLAEKYFTDFSRVRPVALTGASFNAITDIVVTLGLVYYLRKNASGIEIHRDSSTSRVDTVVTRIVLYSISTGMLTMTFATATLISYAAWPRDFYYLFFAIVLGELYTNSYLATLNLRDSFRKEIEKDDDSLSSFRPAQILSSVI